MSLSISQLGMIYELPDGSSVEALRDLNFNLEAGEILTVLGPSGCGKTTLLNIIAGFLAPTSGSAALRDLNFNLEAGEILTVLGPSGCGKTTLLNIIAGFLAPTSGTAAFRSQPIDSPSQERGVLEDIQPTPISGPTSERGMVFQHGALFEWMTVAENIAFGPSVKGMSKSEMAKIVSHYLETVGLQDFGDKAVYELSGGMQQRVALARCLANEPQLILMDEPLGALDALTREKMQSLILKIWDETKKSIILITHSVEEALLLGERVFVMAPRPGRIEKEYRLPFAKQGLSTSLRDIKLTDEFTQTREEILSMIWEMEEDIMGKQDLA